MIKANIDIATSDRTASKALIASVQPDNLYMKGLVVRGRALDHMASFKVEYDGKVETFISTLDDLLRCLQAARETLGKVSKQIRIEDCV